MKIFKSFHVTLTWFSHSFLFRVKCLRIIGNETFVGMKKGFDRRKFNFIRLRSWWKLWGSMNLFWRSFKGDCFWDNPDLIIFYFFGNSRELESQEIAVKAGGKIKPIKSLQGLFESLPKDPYIYFKLFIHCLLTDFPPEI